MLSDRCDSMTAISSFINPTLEYIEGQSEKILNYGKYIHPLDH